ncbi:Os03g0223200 [Oryza sativa Japonica Group]|uniref:cinnamyl-alcohol dehydrogenase n=1 Tax=Oryza nivara TaxID=4536 RepID=A0A0E0HJY5_ORYNI|nr:Putative mannitol dehydrogenase (NAD-dependent mannitol dehydrogenase) [Oryza sativa Japonica Group]BAH92048.1 Os03g0223200 [Oryza sativa Japonica Group]|eukprot:NP_001173320.1 Os03g0223200 [Oryza sativa Japonica Group]
MEQQPKMVTGWAARDANGLLSPFSYPLRAKGDEDVVVKILFCGICHSDLSTIKNEWGNAKYPVVPGHEIVGVVAEVGSSVARFAAGDTVGVGYIASTCRACANCRDGFENYCAGLVPSFNAALPDGATVHGGFSELAVVNQRYVVRIPGGGGGASPAPLDRLAPLLCAGVTVYCPMRRLGLDRPGVHLGVAGLGGLGHLAVKFGKAFGVKVTVISTSPWKEAEAVERLGADAFLLSTNAEQMKAAAGTMDGIIDTVSAVHDLTPLITLLRTHGQLVPVGSPGKPVQLALYPLQSGPSPVGPRIDWAGGPIRARWAVLMVCDVADGKSVAGSMIGGMRDTQEMVDFAVEHGVAAEVEVIGMEDVNGAMERLQKGDVRYRFVIDVANTMARAR